MSHATPAVDVGRLLPHRQPFLLLDRVTELEPGVRGRAIKRVSAGDVSALGRQASSPALLVEACAQLLAIVSSQAPVAGQEAPAAAVGYLAGVDAFTIEHLPRPGDTLILEVRIVRRFGPLLQAEAEVELEGRPVGGGRLTVSSPRPDPG